MVNANQLINDSQFQRLQWLTFSETIAAGGNGSNTVSVSDDGHFHCKYIGGQYTSLTAEDADGGACPISVKISDNGRNGWNLIDNLAPMSLFCTPGRMRTSGVTGDPSHMLFSPLEFDYLFLASSTIRIEYANANNYANTFWLIFYGEKLFKGQAPA